MHIIKMLIILITKENTAITMIAGILGTANFEGDIKAADLQVLIRATCPGLLTGGLYLLPREVISIAEPLSDSFSCQLLGSRISQRSEPFSKFSSKTTLGDSACSVAGNKTQDINSNIFFMACQIFSLGGNGAHSSQ